jgi:uncharacterized membrane protein
MANEFSPTASAALPKAIVPRTVDAGHGLTWWTEGWRLFTPSAGIWILIVVILFAINLVLAFVPLVGNLAAQVLFPVFAGGLMLGCRAIDRGESLSVNHLFAGFSQRFGPLFVVGLIYTGIAICIVFIVVVLLIVFFGAAVLSQLWNLQDPIVGAALLGGLFSAVMVGILLFLLLYLPLVMAIWFAPALIVLRGAEPWAAMKLSFSGCLANILPFLIYGLLGIVFAVVATVPLMLGWLVLGPVTIATFYTGYCDIYEEAPPSAAA